MGINVGIDLGTTYSAVAVFDNATGQASVYKNSDGKTCTPSVTHIENGKVTIGDEAKHMQSDGDLNAVSFYKSMMGEKGRTLYVDGREYSPEELSALYLRELINDISRTNNMTIDGAVITCPAYFNEEQRIATQNAGKQAGIRVLNIINEPTAAIIAYGLTGTQKKTVMVYDLGGGTFDVTIAEVDGSNVRMIATNGNHQLGGKDWDAVITEELRQRFLQEFSIDIEDNLEDFNHMVVQSEEIKKRLTSVLSTTAVVKSGGYTGKYEITREFFNTATLGLLNKTILQVNTCFSEIGGGFTWNDLHEVVLVGGSTRMPQVKDFIRRELGRDPVTQNIDVDTVVAVGAAMQAKICVEGQIVIRRLSRTGTTDSSSEKRNLVITGDSIQDITSHGLGMLAFTKDEKSIVNSPIIKKNSPLNQKFGKPYSFGGEKMDVYVLQGESDNPRDCKLLYRYSVSGFTRGQKKEFTLYYVYNQNGVIDVTVETKDGFSLNIDKQSINETIDEVINRLLREKEQQKRQVLRSEIMFMVDTSYSMVGEPIEKAREAVRDFLKQINLSQVTVSILNFADTGRFLCQNEKNINNINNAIPFLDIETCGIGNDETPMHKYGNMFSSKDIGRFIVLLTDGVWNDQPTEERAAERLKADGITIYAVGLGGSDDNFLNKIASEKGARKIDLSKLSQTFVEIANSIATEG